MPGISAAAPATVDRQAGMAVLPPGSGAVNLSVAASRAYFVRFVPVRDMTITKIAFLTVTIAGSSDDPAVDVGLYSVSGTTLTRLVSTGATTGQLNAGGLKALTVTATALTAGTVYYAGFSSGAQAGTAAAIAGLNLQGSAGGTAYGTDPSALEAGFKAASHPLPDPTVSSLSSTSIHPLLWVRES